MFEAGYKFNLIDSKKMSDGFQLSYQKYNFKTSIRRYIAIVEKYQGNIYIIKYHAACHQKSPHKFRLLLNDERPAPIIRTCIDIMLKIYEEDSTASFGFIGSPTKDKKRGKRVYDEGLVNTQRFRIYYHIMVNYFGLRTFMHTMNRTKSAYLMINRCNEPIEKFKEQAELAFANHYSDFGS
jgi:hypothetical protein